jgi:hypothetical protein
MEELTIEEMTSLVGGATSFSSTESLSSSVTQSASLSTSESVSLSVT